MTKTKVAFAGVMGAILMSVGANAATTSVATKGYVDKLVGDTVTSMNAKHVTMQQVADAIGVSLANGKIDLSRYQLTENIVTTALAEVVGDDKNTKYPSVGAVLAAIEAKFSTLGLDSTLIEQLQELLKDDGVVSQINTLQGDVNILKSSVETLNGPSTDEKSVAGKIAKAIEGVDATYQEKSSAAYSFGTAAGGWEALSGEQQAALNSKITAEKVTAYDELTGDTGTVAELQKAIDGLNGENGTVTTINTKVNTLETVVGNETSGLVANVKTNAEKISTNTTNIATNTAAIAANDAAIKQNAADILKKITEPTDDCTGPENTCVLMIKGDDISWAPVTYPVDDPVTSGATGEAMDN